MKNLIKEKVSEYLAGEDVIGSIVSLYGDASYRQYFRVELASGRTLIIMKMPDGISSASEEITNYTEPDELPYINISNYLMSRSLPVSEIYANFEDDGIIILEDLGSSLFYNRVVDANDKEKLSFYKMAIDLLVSLQAVTKDGDSIAFKRSFDNKLLNWEFDHFLEYGIEKRLGIKVDSKVREDFTAITHQITSDIEALEFIFVHRDFQSKNLMIKNDALYMIDFQDALMGPYVYDLVALLRDSYVEINDKLLKKLLKYYSEKIGCDFEQLQHHFSLVTIQRKLKDAGRFVYIEKVKGNADFLKHIPRSLECVRSALKNTKKYSRLFDLLKPYVEEWQ